MSHEPGCPCFECRVEEVRLQVDAEILESVRSQAVEILPCKKCGSETAFCDCCPGCGEVHSLKDCPKPDTFNVLELFRQMVAMEHEELRDHVGETTAKVAAFVASQPNPELEALILHDVITNIVDVPGPPLKMHISKVAMRRDICECGHPVERHEVKAKGRLQRPDGHGCDSCTECTGYKQKEDT